MKKIIILIIFFGAIGSALFYFKNALLIRFFRLTSTLVEEGVKMALIEQKQNGEKSANDIEVVASNLKIPWEIAFLPNGDILATERPGTLKRITEEKRAYVIDDVKHIGEGGLLGMALHPQFRENRWLYLYLTTATDGGLKNRVERYHLEGDRLSEKKVIVDDIPGASYHDGGRIVFGSTLASDGATAGKPDYYLYITTGDAGKSDIV